MFHNATLKQKHKPTPAVFDRDDLFKHVGNIPGIQNVKNNKLSLKNRFKKIKFDRKYNPQDLENKTRINKLQMQQRSMFEL